MAAEIAPRAAPALAASMMPALRARVSDFFLSVAAVLRGQGRRQEIRPSCSAPVARLHPRRAGLQGRPDETCGAAQEDQPPHRLAVSFYKFLAGAAAERWLINFHPVAWPLPFI